MCCVNIQRAVMRYTTIKLKVKTNEAKKWYKSPFGVTTSFTKNELHQLCFPGNFKIFHLRLILWNETEKHRNSSNEWMKSTHPNII